MAKAAKSKEDTEGEKPIAVSCTTCLPSLPPALMQCCNISALSVTYIGYNKHKVPFTDQSTSLQVYPVFPLIFKI